MPRGSLSVKWAARKKNGDQNSFQARPAARQKAEIIELSFE